MRRPPLNTDPLRPLDAALALAEAIFGPDPCDEPEPATAALGKLWGTVHTGRASVMEVRVGWISGRQFLQFLERTSDDTNKHLASILIQADGLLALTEHLIALTRYERGT